ncbi:hypothetical protein DRO54_06855 [Candidatus Bathyarchaeota archaeon]|nr:MAG: hypothetical protein DRO54_06855 [Candidatus Bathyarchaeota archaeon]
MVSKVSVTVIVGSIWLAFILLYIAFLSGFLTLVQNILVILASLIIAGGIIAAIWTHESSES